MKKFTQSSKDWSKSFFTKLIYIKDIYKAGTMISLKDDYHLLLVLKKIGYKIITLSLLNTKESSRFRMLHNFGKFLIKMVKNHGEVYTVKYLKASQLCIQKKLAGQPLSSMREIEPDYNFPRLSRSGLPSIIKLQDRSAICNRSLRVIRMWLSIFTLYRIIKIPFTPKLNTITDPFNGSHRTLDDFNTWLTNNSLSCLLKFSKFSIKDLEVTNILKLVKSSPLGSVSYSHLIDSYWSIKQDSVLFGKFKEYIELTKSLNLLILFDNIEFLKEKYNITGIGSSNGPIGKLSFKEEAAGKLRVFAMVDIITQSLFSPLHNKLFNLFRHLPNDFTNDQNSGFLYAQTLSVKYNCSYGFDLSAATDRLPLSSQITILNSLFGIGSLWGSILVDRDYIISINDYDIPPQSLRYAVGQPMGALSSWAMLNLTHHMMIQYLAQSLNKVPKGQWYDQYVVLGDDLSLYDKDIALEYQNLCQGLGISINLSKSIISENLPVLEFAKRTSYYGNDVSPLSFKELLTSNSLFTRLSVTTRLINNNWGKNLWKLFIIGNLRSTTLSVKDRIYPLIAYATQLVNNKQISLVDLLSLILYRNNPKNFSSDRYSLVEYPILKRTMEDFFKTKIFKNPIESEEGRLIGILNIMSLKLVMVNRIKQAIRSIMITDNINNRIHILDELISSPNLDEFYTNLIDNNISLELDKPLTQRSYYNEDSFKEFKTIFIGMSPFSNIFFNLKSGSLKSLRNLKDLRGIDLNPDTGNTYWLAKYDLKYFSSSLVNTRYVDSRLYLNSEVESFLKDHNDLLALYESLTFYRSKTNIRKIKLDNPLKILEFANEISGPLEPKSFWIDRKSSLKIRGVIHQSNRF